VKILNMRALGPFLKGLVCVSLGLTTGCGGLSSILNPTLSGYQIEDPYNMSNEFILNSTSDCGLSPSAATNFMQLNEQFSNGSSSQTVPSWPTSNTISMYINTADPNSDDGPVAQQAATDALNQWNSILHSRASGVFTLGLTITTHGPNSATGTIALGTPIDSSQVDVDDAASTQLQLSSDGTHFTNAYILLSDPADHNSFSAYDFYYGLTLHELGHALGLEHNPSPQSVMYPTTRSPSTGLSCIATGWTPPAADTANLEATYDPHYVTVPCSTTVPLPCNGCRASAPKNGLPSTAPMVSPSMACSASMASHAIDSPLIRSRALGELAQSRAPSGTWIHLPEDSSEYTVSSESLVLASTIVAQVRVKPSLPGTIMSGGQKYVITPVVVQRTLKKLFGPDSDTKANDVLYVAEPVPFDDTDYLDEPRMTAGTSPITFLQIRPRWSLRASGKPIYTLTDPFISKWQIGSDGKIAVMGLTTTTVAKEVDGLTVASLGMQATVRYGLSAVAGGEKALVTAMLARRGFQGPNATSVYRSMLLTSPPDLAHRFGVYDQSHQPTINY